MNWMHEDQCGENRRRHGVTMLELLVVVLIISILAIMAAGVYESQIRRARYSVARSEIRELCVACYRYEIDMGEFPPSSSGTGGGGASLYYIRRYAGNGFMYMALQRSMSNNPLNPYSPRWQGPYLNMTDRRVQEYTVTATNPMGISSATQVMLLDPWGGPYTYCRGGEIVSGVPYDYEVYYGTKYPVEHPYADLETFFNPLTFQIFSCGENGITLETSLQGLDSDDVTNFEGRAVTQETYIL
ncbi:prepilin-type N-terminal cleavage/methylation domain-containing protein [Candidatus Sumerlaeota bacterium]|nr:prepilin-type N-terminal cleavage/methylation domain-containing protein [Candidatus Sumerlaeota bacterium]